MSPLLYNPTDFTRKMMSIFAEPVDIAISMGQVIIDKSSKAALGLSLGAFLGFGTVCAADKIVDVSSADNVSHSVGGYMWESPIITGRDTEHYDAMDAVDFDELIFGSDISLNSPEVETHIVKGHVASVENYVPYIDIDEDLWI